MVPFALVIFEILDLSYAAYILDSITVKTFNSLYRVAGN